MTRAGIVWTVVLALSGPAVAAAPPNVLFIAVDDLNDWIEPLDGHPQTRTPNLTRLAEQGVTFTRAYCSAPACNPSRTSLLTGLSPSRTGVYHNDQPWRPVLPGAVTLPQYFRANGYKTHGYGKIFHGSLNDPASWDDWARSGPFGSPAKVPANGIADTAQFDWGPIDGGDDRMGDTGTVDRGIAVLRQKHDRPFFLAVGLVRPHLPFYAPKSDFDRFPLDSIRLPLVRTDDLDDVPPAGRKFARARNDHQNVIRTNNWEKAVQAYLACIHYADRQIGRLLDELADGPHAANTLVVLWGDHGWHLGQKEHWRKFALWEEATRVPLLVVAPGVTTAGTRCARTVSLIDLYPTLVELCGLPAKSDLDGVSLVPLLRSPASAWERPARTTHGRGNHAVRSERWRYIRYADGSEELYDHDTDPREWTNLAGKPGTGSVTAALRRSLPQTEAADAPREPGQGKASRGGP